MGRPLYSVDDSETLRSRQQKIEEDALLLLRAKVQKWSPCAFNPDSDEFFADAVKEYGVSPEGLKEHLHETNRVHPGSAQANINATRSYRPFHVSSASDSLPLRRSTTSGDASGEGNAAEWELVSSAHVPSPLANTYIVETEEPTNPEPNVYELHANRLRAHFLVQNPSAPSTVPSPLPTSPMEDLPSSPAATPPIIYRQWTIGDSQDANIVYLADSLDPAVTEPPAEPIVFPSLTPAFVPEETTSWARGPFR